MSREAVIGRPSLARNRRHIDITKLVVLKMRPMSIRWVAFVAMFGLLAGAGCSSSGGGGGTTSCTLTRSGAVVMCYTFDGSYPSSASSQICDETGQVVGAHVSACPTADVVGTCNMTFSVGGTTGGATSYQQFFYGAGGTTCEMSSQSCAGANGVVPNATATFVGNGC